MRAVIVGTEGTPYHNALFFFDVYFPSSYPHEPPEMNYHSDGGSLNPVMFGSGRMCLSLLNTWSGRDTERWMPCVSTMLQVLVSIQGLILTSKAFFYELRYESPNNSANYNEDSYIASLRTMLCMLRLPPKHFEDFVLGHFCKHARDIFEACTSYMRQDNCSAQFREFMAVYVPNFVSELMSMVAENNEEFLNRLEQRNDGGE